MISKVLVKNLKLVAVALLVYLVLLSVGIVASLLYPLAGVLFTTVLIIGNLLYIQKISEGTKRLVKQEFLPVLVTWGTAFVLQQWLDYLLGMLSLIALAYRAVDLYSRAAATQRPHPRHLIGRKIGPTTRKSIRGSNTRSPRMKPGPR